LSGHLVSIAATAPYTLGGSGRTPQSVGSVLGLISGTTPPTLGSNSDTGSRASQDKSRLGHAAASLCILRDSLTTRGIIQRQGPVGSCAVGSAKSS